MGLIVRTVGMARARLKIGLANLAYNMRRFVWLQTRNAPHEDEGGKKGGRRTAPPHSKAEPLAAAKRENADTPLTS